MTLAQRSADPEQQPQRAGMRLIVPLQGVVQGRGGLFLGTLVPCGLFYFLQLYLKRRSGNSPPNSSNPPSPSTSSPHLSDLIRSSSRTNLFSRGGHAPPRVSNRAASIAKPSDSAYYLGLERVSEDPYDQRLNPDGIIQLGLAENRLCLDMLEQWMNDNLPSIGDSIDEIAPYLPFDGSPDLKQKISGFMSRIMGGVSFDSSGVIVTSGATSAIEILSFCLADHGNAFLIPTPYYPGFDRDIRWRTGVELIPVHCRSTDNFMLSITALDQAYNQARKRGMKVRGVIICNPMNPIGNPFPRQLLFDILDFAREKNVHVISDEVFAGSVHGTDEFVSMAEVITEDYDKERVHIVYGLSKDLGIPGFRAGVIYSQNKIVLSVARKLCRFSPISGVTQKVLMKLLSDETFIEDYIVRSKVRLRKMCGIFVEGMRGIGVPCLESGAGFYCWVNLSDFISSYSEKGELELWEKLIGGKVNVTPGSACHCIEPGWFRCCFSTLGEDDVPLLMNRIREVVVSCTSRN